MTKETERLLKRIKVQGKQLRDLQREYMKKAGKDLLAPCHTKHTWKKGIPIKGLKDHTGWVCVKCEAIVVRKL